MNITSAKLIAAFDRRDARQANERNAEILRARFAGRSAEALRLERRLQAESRRLDRKAGRVISSNR